MSIANQMVLNGRNASGNAILTYGLANDTMEVRGFGQPVTKDAARKMVDDYHDEIKSAYELFDVIANDARYEELKNNPGFERLKAFLSAESQVVSGVFGKEIILQMLAQRRCDGIRYVVGVDGGKNTIILVGVEQVPGTIIRNGEVQAKSKPVGAAGEGLAEDDEDPIKGEVHKNSFTLKEYYEQPPATDRLSDIVFGTF